MKSGCGRETDCLLEGSGFELPVPREIALWSKSGLALHLGSLALRRRGPDWNGRPTAEAWEFERMLALLFKLQEMRRSANPT